MIWFILIIRKFKVYLIRILTCVHRRARNQIESSCKWMLILKVGNPILFHRFQIIKPSSFLECINRLQEMQRGTKWLFNLIVDTKLINGPWISVPIKYLPRKMTRTSSQTKWVGMTPKIISLYRVQHFSFWTIKILQISQKKSAYLMHKVQKLIMDLMSKISTIPLQNIKLAPSMVTQVDF